MVRPTTETGTCLILLEQDTEMFLANISNVILHWPLNTLDALFRQPSRIAVEGLPRPHASLSDTSRRLVQILKYWVHGAPDVIPLALFLLLRLRRSWENGGASTWCIDSIDPKYVGPIWLSAAMVASYKFLGEDDQSPQANASWAAYLRMGRKVLNDAELSLLQGIGWGVWVQARELEAWKDMLEALWHETERLLVPEVPQLTVPKRRRHTVRVEGAAEDRNEWEEDGKLWCEADAARARRQE